ADSVPGTSVTHSYAVGPSTSPPNASIRRQVRLQSVLLPSDSTPAPRPSRPSMARFGSRCCRIASGFVGNSRREWVADSHAVTEPAVLKIIAEKKNAALKLRGGDDRRISPSEVMTALEVASPP